MGAVASARARATALTPEKHLDEVTPSLRNRLAQKKEAFFCYTGLSNSACNSVPNSPIKPIRLRRSLPVRQGSGLFPLFTRYHQ